MDKLNNEEIHGLRRIVESKLDEKIKRKGYSVSVYNGNLLIDGADTICVAYNTTGKYVFKTVGGSRYEEPGEHDLDNTVNIIDRRLKTTDEINVEHTSLYGKIIT